MKLPVVGDRNSGMRPCLQAGVGASDSMEGSVGSMLAQSGRADRWPGQPRQGRAAPSFHTQGDEQELEATPCQSRLFRPGAAHLVGPVPVQVADGALCQLSIRGVAGALRQAPELQLVGAKLGQCRRPGAGRDTRCGAVSRAEQVQNRGACTICRAAGWGRVRPPTVVTTHAATKLLRATAQTSSPSLCPSLPLRRMFLPPPLGSSSAPPL